MNYSMFDSQSEHQYATQSKYALPESASKPKILDDFKEIQDLLDKMNSNIQKIFQKKQKEMQDQYAKEMAEEQEKYRQLAEKTSEVQLRKKLQAKKEEIELEKQEILKASMEFNNDCKQYKETLSHVVNITKDLEAEIAFLNE